MNRDTRIQPAHTVRAAPLQRDARLLEWERVMRRANGEARVGHVLPALAGCHEALALAHQLMSDLSTAGTGDAGDSIAALVVSRHNLADLHADAGCIDLAAAQRSRAHEELIALVLHARGDADLQLAALRHARETHAGLMHHLTEHGDHPAITRALQAGCLAFSACPDTLH